MVIFLLITLNHILFIRRRCHNINGLLGRHGMMWFFTIALRRGGNKQPLNWVANLRLRHKEIWVSLAAMRRMVYGMGKPYGCQGLNKLGHLNTTCGNCLDWQQEWLPQVKFITPTIKKYLNLIRVIYHGALKIKDQKVLRSLNLKPHLKISRFCLKLGRNFCWVQMLWVLVVDKGWRCELVFATKPSH
jgi:hypothetical protein